MAIVHFINNRRPQTKASMAFVLQYIMKDVKIIYNGKKLVSGIGCSPSCAYAQFRNTKLMYGKDSGRQYYHFVQSFPTGEAITPETAHEIACRLANESEKFRGFGMVVATHCDRDHIHSHFVLNSVNAENGGKFHISTPEVEQLMKLSDALIVQYGLTVHKSKPKQRVKPMSDREYRSAENGQSWKLKLAMDIEDAMKYAVSREHFIELMEAEGYRVKWTDTRKNITYTTPDGKRCCDDKLHEEKFLKGNMDYEFRIRAQITEGITNANATEPADSRFSTTVHSGNRAELESYDCYATGADYAVGAASNRDGQAVYQSGIDGISRQADRIVADTATAVTGSDRGIHGVDDRISEADMLNAEHADDGTLLTGWEDERTVFTESVTDGNGNEETLENSVLDFASADSGAGSLGIGAAYMAADVIDILDNDHPVEDCTTRHYGHRQKKKNDGPIMGGM